MEKMWKNKLKKYQSVHTWSTWFPFFGNILTFVAEVPKFTILTPYIILAEILRCVKFNKSRTII